MNGRFTMSNYNTYNPSSPFKLSVNANKDSTESQSKSDISVHLSFLINHQFINPFYQIQCAFPKEEKNNDSHNVNYLKSIFYKTKKEEYIYLKQCISKEKEKLNQSCKEISSNISTVDNEINWVTKEKIESLLQKEKYDGELENYNIRKYNNYLTERNALNTETNMSISIANNTSRAYNFFNTLTQNFGFNTAKNSIDMKKLNILKEKFEKLEKNYAEKRKQYPSLRNEYYRTVGENKVLTENYKQKQMIYEQIEKDLIEKKKLLFKLQQSKSSMISGETGVTNSNSSINSTAKKEKKVFGFFKKIFN